MSKDNDVIVINEGVKKRGRGGKYNFPNAIEPGSEDSDTIRRVLSQTLRWYDRGSEDRPTTDDGIFQRSREFIQHCIDEGERPTVENYCLALGYARQTVNQWKNGIGCSSQRTDIIKKAFDSFAAFDTGMASEGKLNPVFYFFRAKNYYDMRDQVDIVTESRQSAEYVLSEDEMKKFAELSED